MSDDMNVKSTQVNYPAGDTAPAADVGGAASTAPASSPTTPRVDAGGGSRAQAAAVGQSDSGPILISPKSISPAILALVLQDLSSKLSRARISAAKERISMESKDNQDAHNKRAEDLKKANAAKEKAKHHSKLGKIFGWIGVALVFVAAAVVTVVSGGAAAAPLFAVALLMTGLMIAQQTGEMNKLEKSMNLDEKGKLGFMIAVTAAMLIISIVAVVASGGLAAASVGAEVAETASAISEVAAAGAETASTGAEVGATAAETASETAETAATVSETTSELTEATSETTEAATESSEATSESSEATAQSSEATSESSDATSETSESAEESDEATQAAKRSANTTNKVANRVSNAVNAAGGGASIGGGVEGIKTAQDEHDSAMAEADSQDQQARLEQIQMINQLIIKRIKKILDDMQATTGAVIAILNSSSKATQAAIKAAV